MKELKETYEQVKGVLSTEAGKRFRSNLVLASELSTIIVAGVLAFFFNTGSLQGFDLLVLLFGVFAISLICNLFILTLVGYDR